MVLGEELSDLAKKYKIAVVPGGGKFADAVRDFDAKFGLAETVSHKMAILAMDQYGLFLSKMIPNSSLCDTLTNAKRIARAGLAPVFLPSKLLSRHDPFEPSWDVTSDSIAAYLAAKLQAKKAIFATDVDGIFTRDPKRYENAQLLSIVYADELAKLDSRTSVDKFLPRFLKEHKLDCYVVNGNHRERIGEILAGQKTTCTRIL